VIELNNKTKADRIYWVDIAKLLGIFLVYYGHVVEEISNKGNPFAFLQFKFIYSFHMPLFFILAGFFFKRRHPSWLSEIKELFYKRVIPVLFFGALTLPVWPVYMHLVKGSIEWDDIALKACHYLKGHPDLNTITWFIVCLFTTEVIALFVLRKVNKTIIGLIVAAIFFRFGLLMTLNIRATVTSLGIPKNTWYIHEAIVAFGLYAVGYSTFKYIKALSRFHPVIRFLLAVIALALTILIFDLNAPYEGFIVIMKTSNHGVSGYFLLTAFLGTLTVILVSTLIPKNKILDFIGKNTLILVATSGIFHEFINPLLVRKLNNLDSTFWVTVDSLIISLVSLALSLLVVWLLDKFIPQLVGKPHQIGPWLPGLDSFFSSIYRKLVPFE
jgi:fucose 4-O-acetylase-like acetyltransferase